MGHISVRVNGAWGALRAGPGHASPWATRGRRYTSRRSAGHASGRAAGARDACRPGFAMNPFDPLDHNPCAPTLCNMALESMFVVQLRCCAGNFEALSETRQCALRGVVAKFGRRNQHKSACATRGPQLWPTHAVSGSLGGSVERIAVELGQPEPNNRNKRQPMPPNVSRGGRSCARGHPGGKVG